MKFTTALVLLTPAAAFSPAARRPLVLRTTLNGYLDDLSNELRDTRNPNPIPEDETREATRLDKDKVDRYSVGDWSGFVDFDEFDGGDGQMGVAGDGKKGLDKEWEGASEMAKSKAMSAKNAWGKSTGYADTLIDQGMDTQRAQQLENWQNQQEVLKERQAHRYMTESYDEVSTDENWRDLSKFGVERTQVRREQPEQRLFFRVKSYYCLRTQFSLMHINNISATPFRNLI